MNVVIVMHLQQCYEPGRMIGEDSESAWIRCSEDYECASKCIVVCLDGMKPASMLHF